MEQKDGARKTLYRFVADPDTEVLSAVLASPSLLQTNPQVLYDALVLRLQTAWSQVNSGNKVTRKNAEAVAKQV